MHCGKGVLPALTQVFHFLLITWCVLLTLVLPPGHANHDARRLYDYLMHKKNYNKLVRPVGNHSAPVVVELGLRFAQLIDVVS